VPLPPQLDLRLRTRLDELLKEGEELVALMEKDDQRKRADGASRGHFYGGHLNHQDSSFFSLRTKLLSLIDWLPPNSRNINRLSDEVASLDNNIPGAKKILGVTQALKSDYESGMFDAFFQRVEANITSDYLEQAEELFNQGTARNPLDHVAGAVLTGAILEDAVRRICSRQSPPIDTKKLNGENKALNALIDEIYKVGLINGMKADQLRGWAKIRNSAAHGQFTEFTREDVAQMITGVKNFLADYM